MMKWWKADSISNESIFAGIKMANNAQERGVDSLPNPDPRFLCPADATVTSLHGDFQCCHHRLQRVDVPSVGGWNQLVSLLARLPFRSVVSGSQAAQTDRAVTPRQRIH